MLPISRQILQFQNLSKLCGRSMVKWRPYPKKKIAEMRLDGWIFSKKGLPLKRLPDRRIPSTLSVILIEQHEELGNKGEMVSVRPGYARNTLIREGIAVYATEENKKLFLSTDSSDGDPESALCSRFLGFLKRIQLKIQRKEGKEFFEVNEHHIALEYESQFELFVPAHCVKLDEPIKSFGDFEVNIAVKDNLLVPMKVSVERWDPILPEWVEEALRSEEGKEEHAQAKTN